jgi:hypothetical protein
MPEMSGRTAICPADLQVALESPTQSQQMVLGDALRLLAVWAVRASHGQTEASSSDLTVRPSRAMNAPQTAAKESS